MLRALWWKDFYSREREALGEAGLAALLDDAPALRLPPGGALVFPHARLSGCGTQVAAVANAVVASGCDEVLAVGVLHGAREADAADVKRARGGDPAALRALRRIHGPGAPHDAGHSDEEFSLDTFHALVEVAARRAGRSPPRVLGRFPFLVGDRVDDLPGLDELRRIHERGAVLVATADHVHHGVGYRTPREHCLPSDDPGAMSLARRTIEASLELLRLGNLPAFQRLAADHGSDFRDPGPVIAALLPERGRWEARIEDLALVGYADVLDCDEPTWVAAALVSITPDRQDAPAEPLGRCG